MSKKSTAFQYKSMCWMYQGKRIFNPSNTRWIDEHLACVREWIANVSFHREDDTVITIDANYHYGQFEEEMGWPGLKSMQVSDVLLTHLDTDRTGTVEVDDGGFFQNTTVYLDEIKNRYLTGGRECHVLYRLGSLPRVRIPNEKVLPRDEQAFTIDDIQIEYFLVLGHTQGHMVYLLDGRYLLTGDVIWLSVDGGYSFFVSLTGDNRFMVRTLTASKAELRAWGLRPLVIMGHTGYSADLDFVFVHRDLCYKTSDKRYFNPAASYDAYSESGDTGARVVIPL